MVVLVSPLQRWFFRCSGRPPTIRLGMNVEAVTVPLTLDLIKCVSTSPQVQKSEGRSNSYTICRRADKCKGKEGRREGEKISR